MNHDHQAPAFGRWLLSSGGSLVALGLLVLIGRFTGWQLLVTVVPGGAPMAFPTSVGFILLGGTLLAHGLGRRWPALLLATATTLLAGSTVVYYLIIEPMQMVGSDGVTVVISQGIRFDGLMSRSNAMAFVLLGVMSGLRALRRPRDRVVLVLGSVVLAVVVLALFGHATGLRGNAIWWRYSGMALHTACGLLVATVAILGWVLSEMGPAKRLAAVTLPFFTAAGGVIAAVSLTAFLSIAQQEATAQQVRRSQAVVASVNYAELCMTRMESAVRGYLVAREPDKVRTYHDMGGRLRAELLNLRFLVEEDPVQKGMQQELVRLIALERAQLAAALDEAGSPDGRRGLTDPARMAEIRNQVNRMESWERQVMAGHEVETSRLADQSGRIIVFGSGAGFIFFVLALSAAVRAERARLALTQLQGAVLDGADQSVISTTPDGIITIFNAGAERMLGYASAEMVGRATPERFHLPAEVKARANELSAQLHRPVAPGFEAFTALARQGHVDEREWTYVRKDGRHLPVRLSITALRDDLGTITGFVGIAQDLTERKQAEFALKASEERLGQVLGHAECLVWEARVTLEADDWSWQMSVYPSGLYQRLVPAGSHQGAGLWYQFEVPEQPEMNARSRQAMQSGAPGYVQEFRVQKDGQTNWIRETVSIVRTGAGHFWLVGVATDITRLREMTSQLEQSEQRFRNAFDYAGIGMALVGLDGRWLQVNRVLCRLLGYSEAELLAKTFQDITHPEDLDADLAHVQDLLQGRAGHYQMEKRYLHRTGHVVHVQLTVSLVRDAAGAPRHFISQIADITQSKQIMASLAAARDEALAASRLKSEFLANMSHEIRTPMNGVIGMADLLLDSPLNADQRQMGRVIRSSAESLLTIINDILDFSKIEAGKLSIEPVDFSPAEQVQQAIALLTPHARARGLTLDAEFAPDLPAGLSGDAGRIQQVLVNLVGNAVKFTERGGVTVGVQTRTPTRPGRYAFRLEVRDTGIGIGREEGKRLFQPFTQADGSTTRKYGGTGLGLAISQQLIGLMDGRIGFDSELGVGSTFWFELELPVVSVAPVRAAAAESAASSPGPVLRVLVAEDNSANQLVIRLLLDKLGLAYDIVGDGAAALGQLALRDYAVVLMDCQMPRCDGYEATRRIRAGSDGVRQPRIPVIALTAHAMKSDRERCVAAGMDDYLTKPVRLELLRETLRRAGVALAPAPAVSAQPFASDARKAVLEPTQLAQLRELPGRDGGTLLDDLITMALRDLPPELLHLGAAVERRAGSEVAAVAHRLAGSAANIGASALRQALQDIEFAGRKAEWQAADRARSALEREWKLVRETLRTLQTTPS